MTTVAACNWWAYLGGGIGIGMAIMFLFGYPLMERWGAARYCSEEKPDD